MDNGEAEACVQSYFSTHRLTCVCTCAGAWWVTNSLYTKLVCIVPTGCKDVLLSAYGLGGRFPSIIALKRSCKLIAYL